MALRIAARILGISGAAKTCTPVPPRRLLTFRPFSDNTANRNGALLVGVATAAIAACGATVVYMKQSRGADTAFAEAYSPTGELSERGLNWRERRFLANASLQYDGVAYLSPLDFLEAVALSDGDIAAEDNPTHKRKSSSKKLHKRRRRILAEADYRAILRSTPGKRRSSDHLFRHMGANGLISYPEFLFLLNVLSKSNYGLMIAFRAFDRNNDSRLDVEEFKNLYRVVSASCPPDSCSSELLAYGAGLDAPTTSLLVHFFGSDCRDHMSVEEFSRFADNLQREVLLVEFKSGCDLASNTMTPVDFGQAVLRRTRLSGAERRLRLSLLEDRVWTLDGVTAEEYRQFFQFLLHIDDLFSALRMFDIAGKSIDQENFQRAVTAITGQSVSPKLLSIVFALFDVNGDGALSYAEFLKLFGNQDSVLKQHNSLAASNEEHWGVRYKKCIKKYMLFQQ